MPIDYFFCSWLSTTLCHGFPVLDANTSRDVLLPAHLFMPLPQRLMHRPSKDWARRILSNIMDNIHTGFRVKSLRISVKLPHTRISHADLPSSLSMKLLRFCLAVLDAGTDTVLSFVTSLLVEAEFEPSSCWTGSSEI